MWGCIFHVDPILSFWIACSLTLSFCALVLASLLGSIPLFCSQLIHNPGTSFMVYTNKYTHWYQYTFLRAPLGCRLSVYLIGGGSVTVFHRPLAFEVGIVWLRDYLWDVE